MQLLRCPCHEKIGDFSSLFVAALSLFIFVLSKAAEHVEEQARETDDAANDAAYADAMTKGSNSK